MKGFLFSLLVFFSLSLTAQNQAKLCFLKKTIDLGEFVCTKDSIVKINFIFSNNGDAPLVIYNIVASCGCVKPKWPKDTKDRHGVFTKDIYVESNSIERVLLLKIKGNIKRL